MPARAQQTASVSGYIRDAKTGETLLLANVALQGTTRGTSSNDSGYYTITNIEPGRYTIACTFIGYRKFSRDIDLEAGQHLRLDIELQPEGLRLDEIVVESEAEREAQKNIGAARVQTKLIKEVPSVLEDDVFRSVQLLPGVKAASDFSSGLYIRGGSPDQTLILLDRTTVYNPTHFFGFFSTFNPDAIKDVQLYKGAYPAEYGGRLGSVLDIHNKDGNRKEKASTVSLGLLASRIAVEGPYKYGSWMLAFRRSTLEPLLAALRSATDNIPDSFYFFDINGKINLDASPNDKWSLGFYSGTDKVSFPFADDGNLRLDYGNQTLSSSWTHIFSQHVFSNFTLTGARYFNFPGFEIGGTPASRSNNIYDFSVKGDLQYIPNSRHDIESGFWGGSLLLKYSNSFDNETTFTSRIRSLYGSWYLQDTWRPDDRWKAVAGLRLNAFSEGDYLTVDPRVSLEYKARPSIRLQAGYGRYHQFLTLITNEAFSGFDVWLTTDNGIQPAWGDQFVFGVKTQPFEGYGFDVETYYRTMHDLFELDPFVPDPAGLAYPDLFRVGEGYAYGTEITLEKQAGRLNGFIGYTFSVTRRRFPGFNQARYYPPKYDRQHDINIVANYQLSRRWKATAVFNYATGQSYTRPLGRTRTEDLPFGQDQREILVVGKVNASRLPAYHRLDIGFSRKGSFFGTGQAEWQFQLINVYSRRNVWFYQYDFDENPIDRNSVSMLPILPSISYTINF